MLVFGYQELKRGSIAIDDGDQARISVTFTPLPDAVASTESIRPSTIIVFDTVAERVQIFPVDTRRIESGQAGPKYDQIRVISLPADHWVLPPPRTTEEIEAFLEELPRGLTKDPQFGLGFPRDYNSFVQAVESLTPCEEIRFTYGDEIRVIDDACLLVPLDEFETIRSELDRIASRGRAAALNVKRAYARNWLAKEVGLQPVLYSRGRHPMVQALSDSAAGVDGVLNDDDVDELVEVLSDHTRRVPKERSDALAKLRGDIELVELDTLIERFASMLATGEDESRWQDFFTVNPFILSFAFGYPLILVQDQASVGGRRISGTGNKIADFLMKNATTNNVALFEIKKPTTPLLGGTEYRGGVYAPSSELTGSLAQVLDQRYKFTTSFTTLRQWSREDEIESFAVQACLVVGTTPDDVVRQSSFELFRNSLRDVVVVTFDELYRRVETLRQFLAESSAS